MYLAWFTCTVVANIWEAGSECERLDWVGYKLVIWCRQIVLVAGGQNKPERAVKE